jgi:hypothetical protein
VYADDEIAFNVGGFGGAGDDGGGGAIAGQQGEEVEQVGNEVLRFDDGNVKRGARDKDRPWPGVGRITRPPISATAKATSVMPQSIS